MKKANTFPKEMKRLGYSTKFFRYCLKRGWRTIFDFRRKSHEFEILLSNHAECRYIEAYYKKRKCSYRFYIVLCYNCEHKTCSALNDKTWDSRSGNISKASIALTDKGFRRRPHQ